MIPVVFVHRTGGEPPPEYLLAALRQAKARNAEVALLGDVEAGLPGVESCPLPALFGEAEEFAPRYRHMSSNPHGFELFCFQRHFAVKAFMRARGHDRAYVCDSDVMVYRDVSEVGPVVLGDCMAALSTPGHQPKYRWVSSACNAFWTSRGIERFCDTITETYATAGGVATLEEKWDWHRRTRTPGGVCDMTLLWLFAQRYPTGNTMRVLEDGSTFDDNVNSAEGAQPGEYEMDGGMKRVEWRGGVPYVHNLRLGRRVRFNSLHFQSGAKAKMPDFYKGDVG